MRKKRKFWQWLRLATFLLSIFFCLSFWTNCKPRIRTVPIAIGEVRIIGRIVNNVVSFEPGENPAGSYFIITRAFWYETYKLAWKVKALKLEIEKLKAKGEE